MATMAYDEYIGQGSAGTAAQAQTYLTYAEGGYRNLKAVNDCAGSNACYSVFYHDPNFVYTIGDCTDLYDQEVFAQATEAWFMHQPGYTDFNHRLIGHHTFYCRNTPILRSPVYALNHFNPNVRAFEESYLVTYADKFDYILMDETSGQNITQWYGTGGGMCPENGGVRLCTTTEEYPTDASVVQAHDLLFSSLTHSNGAPMKIFFNGLTMNNARATDLDIITGSSHVFGGECEDCVVSLGKVRPDDYVAVLDTMAEINAIPNASFIELNIANDPPGSPAQINERTINAAMAWLGYSPGHLIIFPDFEYGSKDLAIWPEYNIVPTNPVESLITSYVDIQASVTATRVYRREFRTCYNFGVPIGQCAAIVNGNTVASVTVSPSWLKLSYRHVVQLSGGDIPSGGRVLLNTVPFVPASTTLAPGQGILLVR